MSQCSTGVVSLSPHPLLLADARMRMVGHSMMTRPSNTVSSTTSSTRHTKRCALALSRIPKLWRSRRATVLPLRRCACDGSCRRAVSWRSAQAVIRKRSHLMLCALLHSSATLLPVRRARATQPCVSLFWGLPAPSICFQEENLGMFNITLTDADMAALDKM